MASLCMLVVWHLAKRVVDMSQDMDECKNISNIAEAVPSSRPILWKRIPDLENLIVQYHVPSTLLAISRRGSWQLPFLER